MKTLRFWVMLSVAVIAAPAFPHFRDTRDQPAPTDPDRIKEQITQLEQRWQKAVVDRDRSALNGLLALDFSEEEWVRPQVEPGNKQVRVVKRQQYLDKVLKEAFQRYNIDGEVAVIVKDPARAVARLKLTAERAARLLPLSVSDAPHTSYDVVDTWVKTAAGWRVASRQVILAAGGMVIPLKNQD